MEWQASTGEIFHKEKRKKRHSVSVWGILLEQLPMPPAPLTTTDKAAVLQLWWQSAYTHQGSTPALQVQLAL